MLWVQVTADEGTPMTEPEPEPELAGQPKEGYLAEPSQDRNQWPDEPEEVDEETDIP